MNRSSHRHMLDPLHCTLTAGPSVISLIYIFQNNGEEQQEQLYSAFYLQNSNKIRVACTFQTANNLIFNVVAAKWSWFWWLSIKLVCFIDHTSYAALWTINRSTFWCHLCHIYTTGTSTCYYSCKNKSCDISLWGLVRKSTNMTFWTNTETLTAACFCFPAERSTKEEQISFNFPF